MNYFHIPGLNRTKVVRQILIKKNMASISLNEDQEQQLKAYAKSKKVSIVKIVRRALMAYGVLNEEEEIEVFRPRFVKTIYYDTPRDETTINIVNAVCKAMGVNIRRVYCNRRHKKYTMAKHCIRHWLKQETDYTLELIGLLTCQTDHSTVVHSLKTWGHMIETNNRYNDINDKVKNTIKSI